MGKAETALDNGPHNLCIDLDGTLVTVDLLVEQLRIVLCRRPWRLFAIVIALFKGKVELKRTLYREVGDIIDVTSLPFNEVLLEDLHRYRADGHRLYLVTGSFEDLAHKIFNHLELFQECYATTVNTNLTGRNKAELLVELFGEKGFIYAGNEAKDIHIWQYAQAAIVVGSKRLATQTARMVPVMKRYVNSNCFISVARLLRPHQWVKNFLVFLPPILGHTLMDGTNLQAALLAFVGFCMVASIVYIVNDIFDVEADRKHPTKKRRPLASGAVSFQGAALLLASLLAVGCYITMELPLAYGIVLLVYLLLNFAYSTYLKSRVLVDVFLLTSFYALRSVAGGAATNTPLSAWFIAFSVFFFLSLAFAKRSVELIDLEEKGTGQIPRRGYRAGDRSIINLFGVSSGFLSVLILALYINDPKVRSLFLNPDLLWGVCGVMLYWVSHIWFRTSRGSVHSDPVVFALRDPHSYASIGLVGLSYYGAAFLNL